MRTAPHRTLIRAGGVQMEWHFPENLGLSYATMATTFVSEGRYEEALELFEKSLAIAVKVRGPEHANPCTLRPCGPRDHET